MFYKPKNTNDLVYGLSPPAFPSPFLSCPAVLPRPLEFKRQNPVKLSNWSQNLTTKTQ